MGGINLLEPNKPSKKRRKNRRSFSYLMTDPNTQQQEHDPVRHGASGVLRRLSRRLSRKAPVDHGKATSRKTTSLTSQEAPIKLNKNKGETFSSVTSAAPIETAKRSLNKRKAKLDHDSPATKPVPASTGRSASQKSRSVGATSPFSAPATTARQRNSHGRPDIFSEPKLSSAPKVSHDGSIELNLVPERKDAPVTFHRRVKQLGFGVLGAVIIVLVGWGVAYYMQFQSEQTVDDVSGEVAALTAEIASLSDVEQREKDLARHASAVETALKDQHYWSKFLDVLEETVIQNVYWEDVTADPSGTVTLIGIAAAYSDIMDQVNVLKDHEMIRSVSIVSASAAENQETDDVGLGFGGDTGEGEESQPNATAGMRFTLSVNFDPALIFYASTDE